jgi:hypothetical protein
VITTRREKWSRRCYQRTVSRSSQRRMVSAALSATPRAAEPDPARFDDVSDDGIGISGGAIVATRFRSYRCDDPASDCSQRATTRCRGTGRSGRGCDAARLRRARRHRSPALACYWSCSCRVPTPMDQQRHMLRHVGFRVHVSSDLTQFQRDVLAIQPAMIAIELPGKRGIDVLEFTG